MGLHHPMVKGMIVKRAPARAAAGGLSRDGKE
jgi:hypothetical protein